MAGKKLELIPLFKKKKKKKILHRQNFPAQCKLLYA